MLLVWPEETGWVLEIQLSQLPLNANTSVKTLDCCDSGEFPSWWYTLKNVEGEDPEEMDALRLGTF